MSMTEDMPQFVGDPPGTGWRVAAWVAFAMAGAIAGLILTQQTHAWSEVVAMMGGVLLVFVVGALGLVFGLFGAAASSTVGDRRLIVMLPVWANAALLLGFVAAVFAPR
jgi:hypothetical protein